MKLSHKEARLTELKFAEKQNEQGQEVFTFEGYASTFGNVDLDGDVIEPGAFLKSLGTRTPKLLLQHDHRGLPLGIFTDVHEDEVGLFVKGEMPLEDDRVRGGVMPLMKQGALNSMSIGFTVSQDETVDNVRHISETELFEVSLVTFPANPEAQVTSTKDFKALAATLSPEDRETLVKELQPEDEASDELKAAETALKALEPEELDALVKSHLPKLTNTVVKAMDKAELEACLKGLGFASAPANSVAFAAKGKTSEPAPAEPKSGATPEDEEFNAARDEIAALKHNRKD